MDSNSTQPRSGATLFASALEALAPLIGRNTVQLDNAAIQQLHRASQVLKPLNFLSDLHDDEFDKLLGDVAAGNNPPDDRLDGVQTCAGQQADCSDHIEQVDSYESPAKSDLDVTDLCARRSFQSIGSHKTLLLEKGAICDACTTRAPCVICYCREYTGDLLCSSCDFLRHEFAPCCYDRWVLVEAVVDSSASGTKRRREEGHEAGEADNESQSVLRRLLPNEFVDHTKSSDRVVIAECFIIKRVFPAPIRGVIESPCPKCKSCHCRPASWNGAISDAKTVVELHRSKYKHKHFFHHIVSLSDPSSGSWLAGEVFKLQCRRCNNIYNRKCPPASCVAVGYMSTTPHKTHSYIAADVLSSQLIRSQTGLSYSSMSELRSVMGRSTFDSTVSDSLPPVQSLRNIFRIQRELVAHPIGILRGFLYTCFVCGNIKRRLNADSNMKAYRHFVGNSNVVFWQPNSVLLDVRRTEPAVRALKIPDDSRVGSSCVGPVSASHLAAAVERSSRKQIDQHGAYTISCTHECCDCAIEMHSPESISGHHTVGLTLACSSGCNAFSNDVLCICRRHLKARGVCNLAPAIQALSGCASATSDSVGTSTVTTDTSAGHDVSLTVGDEHFAVFDFSAFSQTPVGSDNHEIDRPVPSHPSHFDLAERMKRLYRRALALSSVIGFIPSLHARMHKCFRVFGAFATLGVGAGYEYSEWLYSQVLSKFASAARTMSSTNWRLFTGTSLTFSNQRKAQDLAHEILSLHIRARFSLYRRSRELEDQRSAYSSLNPTSNVSDDALSLESAQSRLRAAMNVGRSVTACASFDQNHLMSLSIKAGQLAGVVGELIRIRDAVAASSTDENTRDAMAVMYSTQSAIALPTIESFSQLKVKIVSQNNAVYALQKKLAGFVFNPNNAIAFHLSQLHDLSTDVASTMHLIDRIIVSAGNQDSTLAGLKKERASLRVKMEQTYKLLKRLMALSPEMVVRQFVLPPVNAISGPECIPSRIGSIIVIPGDVKLVRLVEAFNARRAAFDELKHVESDTSRVLGNIDAVLGQLSIMLRALSGSTPDCVLGAGASGLWGGPPDAMFDLSRAPMAEGTTLEVAAGMAFHIAEGIKMWSEQRVQVTRVIEGLARICDGPHLCTDKVGRSFAMRYGRELLLGRMTPLDWAHVSLSGTLPKHPHAQMVSRINVSSKVALPTEDETCDDASGTGAPLADDGDDDDVDDNDADSADGEIHEDTEEAPPIWDDPDIRDLLHNGDDSTDTSTSDVNSGLSAEVGNSSL